ncbi:hypothetical protein H312_02155, partial [Anncaliia algerae PRA339]
KNLLDKKYFTYYGDPFEEQNESGGYFIINGLEKVFRFLVVQKRNYIFAQDKTIYLKKEKNLTRHSVVARCVGADEIANVISLHYTNDGNILLRLFIRRSEFFIPLMLVIKGMTNISDEDVYKKIVRDSKNKLFKSRALTFLRQSLKNKLEIFEECKNDEKINEIEYLGSIFKKIFYEQSMTNIT